MATEKIKAFDALGAHPKLAALVAIAKGRLFPSADARRLEAPDAAKTKALAETHAVTDEDARTPFGDLLAVFDRAPENDAERALARAIAAHVFNETRVAEEGDDASRLAARALWLATHTPFDALPLIDRALGDASGAFWGAVADEMKNFDVGAGSLSRPEALVAGAAIVASTSTAAQKSAALLAAELHDRTLARLVAPAAPPPSPFEERLTGEIIAAPRGAIATTALALSGLLFVLHGARLVARFALAYKKPAEITLSDATVRIHARTEMLGRTLKDREIVIAREGLVRATREVRYPRASFYAGLLALAIGSYVGVSTLVDGARSASPSLLLAGLFIVALGIALEFVLASLAPGTIGRCRVAFVPRSGPAVCVGGVDAKHADAVLARLRAPRANAST